MIKGESADNAAPFASADGNVSGRERTVSQVIWSPPAWRTKHEGGFDQRTPDLTDIVQEIVDRPGWASGQAIVFIFTGDGERTAEAYEGEPDLAPLLHIKYR